MQARTRLGLQAMGLAVLILICGLQISSLQLFASLAADLRSCSRSGHSQVCTRRSWQPADT